MAGMAVVGLSSFSAGDFSRFYREFEDHAQSGQVMDRDLLRLIQSVFGYPVLSLSRYEQEQFHGIEVVGKTDVAGIKESYYTYFQKRDPFAAYIGRAKAADPGAKTLQSSSAFRGGYFTNEYYRYLSRYGLGWALAMPIGEYRLTVYRSVNDRDFSDSEREAMDLLARMIGREYETRRSLAPLAAASRAEGRILDAAEVGFVLLDSSAALQCCNHTAQRILAGGTDQSLEQTCAGILRAFRYRAPSHANGRAENTPARSGCIHYCGHLISVDRVAEGGERYYCLTIHREGHMAGLPSAGTVMERLGLSPREAEIALLLAQGTSYGEIAGQCFVSINTVRTHVSNIYRKLEIDSKRSLKNIVKAL